MRPSYDKESNLKNPPETVVKTSLVVRSVPIKPDILMLNHCITHNAMIKCLAS